jgi:FtsH-binding integral membrane protein
MTDPAATSLESRLADWRVKAALLIAGFEGLLLLVGRLSRWVLIAVAIPIVLAYLLRRRDLRPGLGRDLFWVAAVSQALTVVAVILVIVIGLLFLILLGVFVALALALIFFDQPGRSTRS